jgi:AbrB family looped-hinge helix DNA binding protein
MMFGKHEFFGSTTVGERGQIVLPADLRKKFNINAGDKLIVIGVMGKEEKRTERVMLLKSEVLNELVEGMEEHKKAIKEILQESEKSK